MLGSAAIRSNRTTIVTLVLSSLVILVPAPATPAAGYAVSVGGDGTVAYLSTTGEGESSAYLGVQIEEEIEHSEGGARVTRVVEDSPADKAGLEEGDVIVGLSRRSSRIAPNAGRLTRRTGWARRTNSSCPS